MAFNRLTLKQLYERIKADMEARLTGDVKIPPTSMLSVVAFGIAGGSFLVQGFLEWIYKQILPDLSDETGLARWGNVFGVSRGAASYTQGEVAFTGTTGIVIASGSQIQNQDGLSYTTQAAFTIGTTTSVTVVADEAGEDWNSPSSLEVVSPVSGVDDTVTNVSGFTDGSDYQTVENWRLAILQRIQNPPSSGTTSDYVRWALELDDVYFAWCFPAEDWNGAGSVGVAVSDADHAQLTTGYVTGTVEPYIEALKPVPASVTYYSPVPVEYDFYISITPNTSATQAAITTNFETLFDADAAPLGTLLISRLNAAVSSGAVSDYEITGIDKDGVPVSVGNLTVTIAEVHKLGTITFSDL